MGYLAGKKAIQIFKAQKPSSIPIDYPKKFDLMINLKTVHAEGFSSSGIH